MFSGISAIFAGLYFIYFTGVTSTFIQFLGIFCILGGLVIFFSLFAVIPKHIEEEEAEEQPYRERLRERTQKRRELYGSTHKKRWDEE